MSVALDQVIHRVSAALGCAEVSIRCACSNLEVVYVELEGEQLVVTDRGETFQYLSRGDDSTFEIGLLDEDTAREICRKHGAELLASDPEGFLRVRRTLSSSDDPAEAVAAVAGAVDAVFNAATRPDLRWPPDAASSSITPG